MGSGLESYLPGVLHPSSPLKPLALSSASLKPILWDGEWVGKKRGFTTNQSILPRQQEEMNHGNRKEMQTKWKSIRDHFTKELKMKKPTKNRKKRKYIYFDNLQFLTPIVESRPKHSNATLTTNSTESQKLEPQETEPLLWKSLQGTSTEDITGNYIRKEASALKRKRCHQEDSVEAVKEFSKILSYSSALQREESQSDSTGNKAFLMSLLPLMNRLNDEEAMSVRMQMMEVVRDGIKGAKRP
uniref:BESS domain-containing protein n=1 Tax=Timema tahoe TaxID=61484 RepID=A0A7R9IIV6_9NEOP|nr:unnamed protein product [Timema tahoe]